MACCKLLVLSSTISEPSRTSTFCNERRASNYSKGLGLALQFPFPFPVSQYPKRNHSCRGRLFSSENKLPQTWGGNKLCPKRQKLANVSSQTPWPRRRPVPIPWDSRNGARFSRFFFFFVPLSALLPCCFLCPFSAPLF